MFTWVVEGEAILLGTSDVCDVCVKVFMCNGYAG